MSFLKRNGFEELKNNRGKRDHCCLKNNESYMEIDKGKKSFSAREMLSFVQ